MVPKEKRKVRFRRYVTIQEGDRPEGKHYPANPPVPCPGIFTVILTFTKKIHANLHEIESFPTFMMDFRGDTRESGTCNLFSGFSTISSLGFNRLGSKLVGIFFEMVSTFIAKDLFSISQICANSGAHAHFGA